MAEQPKIGQPPLSPRDMNVGHEEILYGQSSDSPKYLQNQKQKQKVESKGRGRVFPQVTQGTTRDVEFHLLIRSSHLPFILL